MPNTSQDYDFLYHHFIDQVAEYAIYTLDQNGIINSWNSGAEKIKGYKEKEIIGKHLRICFAEVDVAKGLPEEELKRARLLGESKSQGWRKKKDGSLFWASTVLTAIFDANRQFVGYTKITRDLTEEKKSIDELRHKHKELLQVNLDLDNFIHIATHDMRLPISNMEGLIHGLQEMLQGKADPDILAYIGLLQVSITRFKKTVKELTAVRKINLMIEENHVEKINIPVVFMEVETFLLEGTTGRYHFTTEFQVTEVDFPRLKFKSILYNLLSNAMKYASPDRPSQIHVSTQKSGKFVMMSIRDNGLGIRLADQKQLFKMFKRFHPQVEGTGLGLYSIKRIIEGAGGKITFESEEGKGTLFKVFFKK